jgi:hypothetical protein
MEINLNQKAIDNISIALSKYSYIMDRLSQTDVSLEASFSSKLMATINPDKPVWDEFVLKNLGIIKPPTYSKNRIEKTVDVYKRIEHFYDEFLQTMECQELVAKFDMHFPNTKITKTKKVDLLLWQTRA